MHRRHQRTSRQPAPKLRPNPATGSDKNTTNGTRAIPDSSTKALWSQKKCPRKKTAPMAHPAKNHSFSVPLGESRANNNGVKATQAVQCHSRGGNAASGARPNRTPQARGD